MKYVQHIPGLVPCAGLFVVSDANGEPVAPDSDPTVAIYGIEGGATGDVALSLGAMVEVCDGLTGVYHLRVDPVGAAAAGMHTSTFWPLVTVVVSGLTRKIPLDSFCFVPGIDGGRVALDGSNSATSFKVTRAGDGAGAVLDTTDDAAKNLLRFVSGALAGQIRKITAYNSSTGFVTVDAAFTTTPSDDDAFVLVSY